MIKMLFFDYREQEEKFFDSFNDTDFDITFYKNNLTEMTELTEEEYNETEVISVFVCSQVTEKLINKFKNLRIIATRSTGYNHIDIQACLERNISVVNVEAYAKSSVTQYTLAVMLGLVRNIAPAMKDFQLDSIDYNKYTGYDLSELTLGVIGTGAIGTELCELANKFGMHIFAYDIKPNPKIIDIVDYVSLEDLYKHSNIISLHLPYSVDNYHMLGEKEFDMMTNEVYIINTSRGELIDSAALYKAIKSGRVKGAALDVLECENLNMYPDDFMHLMKESSCDCIGNAIINQKLMLEPNVVITPHIAYSTYQAINNILKITFNNIKTCLKGRCPNRVC